MLCWVLHTLTFCFFPLKRTVPSALCYAETLQFDCANATEDRLLCGCDCSCVPSITSSSTDLMNETETQMADIRDSLDTFSTVSNPPLLTTAPSTLGGTTQENTTSDLGPGEVVP